MLELDAFGAGRTTVDRGREHRQMVRFSGVGIIDDTLVSPMSLEKSSFSQIKMQFRARVV